MSSALLELSPAWDSFEPCSKLVKGVIWGTRWGTIIGCTKEDSRNLDYSSFRLFGGSRVVHSFCWLLFHPLHVT